MDNDLVGPDNHDWSGLHETQVMINSDGQAAAPFQVAHQPGDNHRIAAAMKESALDMLTDANVPPSGTLPATEEQVDGFIGHISPLLTVDQEIHPDIIFEGVSEDDENEPGCFVPFNVDDDDGSGISDFLETNVPPSVDGAPVANEDDLRKVTIAVPWADPEATIYFDQPVGATRVKVYRVTSSPGWPLELQRVTDFPIEWPPGTFLNPVDFYVEGIAPSNEPRDVSLSLAYFPPIGPPAGDTASITVSTLDLDIDANYDGMIDNADEAFETQPRLVGLNDDDDNGNDVADLNDTASVAGENELVLIRLEACFAEPTDVEITAESSEGAVKLWRTPTKGEEVPLPYVENVLCDTLFFWVEGTATGAASLTATPLGAGAGPADTIELDVVTIEPVGGAGLVQAPPGLRLADAFRSDSPFVVGTIVHVQDAAFSRYFCVVPDLPSPESPQYVVFLAPYTVSTFCNLEVEGVGSCLHLDNSLWSWFAQILSFFGWTVPPEVLRDNWISALDLNPQYVEQGRYWMTPQLTAAGMYNVQVRYAAVPLAQRAFTLVRCPDMQVENVAEAEEETPGAFVPLRDEGGGGENQRIRLDITGLPAGMPGTVTLNAVDAGGESSDRIQVYETESGRSAMALPHVWSAATTPLGPEGATLWIEGANPSTALRDAKLTLKYEHTQTICEDEIDLIVVSVDLDVAGVADGDEFSIGRFVAVNNDDDNTNGVPDWDDDQPNADDNDLVEVDITGLLADLPGSVTLTVDSGADLIRMYDRSGLLALPQTWTVASLASDPEAAKLWVEGVAGSAALRDVQLTLAYTGPNVTRDDKVSFTIVAVDLDADGVPDDAEEDPGARVALNIDRDEDNRDATGNPLPDLADGDIVNNASGAVVTDDLLPLLRAISPADSAFINDHEAKLFLSAPDIVRLWAVDAAGTTAEALPLDTNLIPQYFGDAAPRSDWSWYAEGIDCGDVILTLRLSNASGETVHEDRIRILVAGARLRSLAFADNLTVYEDTGTEYTLQDWLDSDDDGEANDVGEHRFPVAYVRNTVGRVQTAEFAMCPGSFATGPTNIRGVDAFGNEYTADSAHITYTTTTLTARDMLANAAFPNEVRYLGHDTGNPYIITWSVSGDNGATWYPAGQNDSRLFLVLNTPSGPFSRLYETVGWISCRNADHAVDTNGVFGGVWSDFTDLDVRRKPVDGENQADGARMGYWLTPNPSQTIAGMLADDIDPKGDGSCLAWSELLIACGNVHGLTLDMLEVTPDTTVRPGATGFLVKHWTFHTPSGGGDYPYLVTVDVVDEPGAAGQGNSNPTAHFGNHFVAQYRGSIYDPSYGTGPFVREADHENAGIDGISSGLWARPQETGVSELRYMVVP